MSDDVFAHHVNSGKNDFSNWLEDVVKHEKLAKDLQNVTDRSNAAGIVVARVSVLTNSLP